VVQGDFDVDIFFSVLRNSAGLMTALVVVMPEGPPLTLNSLGRQLELLPATLERFSVDGVKVEAGYVDFSALAAACPRLHTLWVPYCHLTQEISLNGTLALFPCLDTCVLLYNDLSNSGSGIDCAALPATLTLLCLNGNPRLTGAIVGTSPAELQYDGTGLTI
jgi:hypothetical protein